MHNMHNNTYYLWIGSVARCIVLCIVLKIINPNINRVALTLKLVFVKKVIVCINYASR